MPRKSLHDTIKEQEAGLASTPTEVAKCLGYDLSRRETSEYLLELLQPKEVASILHSTERSLATKRCRGSGPAFIKVGAKVFYRRLDLLRYQQEQVIRPYRGERVSY